MKIFSITPKLTQQIKFEHQNKESKFDDTAGSAGYTSIPYYNTISFQARVDKGMKRFYEVNKDRMPKTLRSFIDKIPDKEMLTPLEANKLAFSALGAITTVAGLKLAFPDEELVQDVKDIDETKATRGILSTYRQYKDLFDKDSLVNGENLSVWLVKKVLLESKTIDEINKDFIKEVDQDFYSFYRESEPDGQPIRHSTLSALEIKMPEKEYMASLRYTREGYSDTMSTILSIAQQEAWEKLSDPEKLARVTKFVLATDKWWDSIPQDVKLDILASQDAELECLKLYNKYKKEMAEKREAKERTQQNHAPNERLYKKEHINTGIKRNDEYFKLWLQNNLAISREKLTDTEKQEISIRQQRKRAENWEAMSAEEQISYISRLKSGSEQMRFAMLETWNNNPEIIIKLSIYLKKQNEKPIEMIYGISEYNKRQSEIMKGFWDKNPDFANKLGESLKQAHQKIKDAKANDSFEILKESILLERANREAYIKNYLQNYKEILSEEEYNSYPEYMKDFIDIYNENSMEYNKHMPVQYIKDFYNTVHEELNFAIVNSWTKALKGEELSLDDELNIEEVRKFEPPQAQIMNRAIEAAAADILYECTEDPRVYLMSQTDCKVALSHIDKGYDDIVLKSHKTGQDFIIKIKNHKINDKKIEELYNYYKTPIENVNDIVANFFIIKNEFSNPIIYNELEKYIENYGKSANHIFSFDSKLPLDAKTKFLEKFLSNIPDELYYYFDCKLKNKDDLRKEEKINLINNKIIRKYNFIPQDMLGVYLYELNASLRSATLSELQKIEDVACKPRKTAEENGKIASINRHKLRDKGNLFTFLCLEQALADALYKATGEAKVYTLKFEELIDNFELFNLVKKYPSNYRYIKPANTNEEFALRLMRKLPLYKLDAKAMEYAQEMREYTMECIEENKPLEKEVILNILSPYTGQEDIDEATLKRIEPIFNELQEVIESGKKHSL